MRESGENLVERIGIGCGLQVLDFAPMPLDVAKEMVRVTRRGARIVMGSWILNDPTHVVQILRISSAYTPAPREGFISPMTWDIESNVIQRFAVAGIASENVTFATDTFTFRCDGPPPQFVDELQRYYGPTMSAFEAAARGGRAANLQGELTELFSAQNTSADGTTIPATFLRVEVIC